ncbi:MAG: type II toxin-antitoxin system PemK/MazF family toxin [Gammaproteobacteria bacterium]
MTFNINHGEVWLAKLNPNKGKEPGKTRPVLVLQHQALLDIKHPTSIILPLTTHLIDNAAPLRIRVAAQDKLEHDSDILIDQIRAIDNTRLIKGPLTTCNPELLEQVYSAINEVMGIPG